jgi:hypothetical protein
VAGDSGESGITTTMSGPMFEGSFASEMQRMTQEMDQKIGDDVVDAILARLGQVLQNPTGYYESQIKAHPEGEVVVVDDSGVIYGPWLEGVGSRNASTSFKGYSTFRTVAAEEQARVPSLADSIVTKYVDRFR